MLTIWIYNLLKYRRLFLNSQSLLCFIDRSCHLQLFSLPLAIEYPWDSLPFWRIRCGCSLSTINNEIICVLELLNYLTLFGVWDLLRILFLHRDDVLLEIDVGKLIEFLPIISHWNFGLLLNRWSWCHVVIVVFLVDLFEYFGFVLDFICFVLNIFERCHAQSAQLHMKWY